jgi:hypothetical protein
MSLEIDVNSYITENDANIYFSNRVFVENWVASKNKDKYLITAFNLLESSFEWLYDKTSEDQVQEFPRNGETAVPQRIIDAQCEIALLLVNSESDLERPDKYMKYDKTTIQTSNVSMFNDIILNLIKDYGKEKVPEQVLTTDVYR